MSLPTTPFDRDSTADDVLAGVDLHGRTALVTGGSSGVGAATAHALARAGARVVLAARGLGTAREVAARITAGTGNEAVTAAPLDLSDPASVRAFVAAWEGPLHMLVNNAGIMALPALDLTPEGWERQFATNHLGHFALATGLRPALAAAGGARVAALSSTGHFASPVGFDDINFAHRPYDPFTAYGQSKTADALFAVEAGKRWAADGIAAHAVMPGGIKSPLQRHAFGDDMDARARAVYEAYPWRSAEQGAATSVLAVASPLLDGVTGAYLQNCQEAPVLDPARAAGEPEPFGVAAWARDAEAAGRLWELSAAAVS
ncbi:MULTISPECIES: SDR family NAD(P)-dependent oxidoreductase [Streptomyces]|uniref:SDR family NAD(P)-dependent oxidoreductase n=2 Tax=Streptomyces TaxID=1883 RepID=A0ABU2R6T3_9ACTN|nr:MULTISPECIES: SDR family NAD(P)-dependent oxidoreductase [unclassified Streptomyces]MDT0412404.1 SDR family NAD(P)-dependent oxidoreductase [Streptomyces sp. DSM 41979]